MRSNCIIQLKREAQDWTDLKFSDFGPDKGPIHHMILFKKSEFNFSVSLNQKSDLKRFIFTKMQIYFTPCSTSLNMYKI